jgi:hypothetical protein
MVWSIPVRWCGMGYTQCNGDHTLFYRYRLPVSAFWEAHHDSCIIYGWYHYYGDDTFELSHLKQKLSKEFEVQDLGQLSYFLAIEIARSPKGIVLSQWKHLLDLLGDVGSAWVSSCSTPIVEENHQLCALFRDLGDRERCQWLVGRLIYLCHRSACVSSCFNSYIEQKIINCVHCLEIYYVVDRERCQRLVGLDHLLMPQET